MTPAQKKYIEEIERQQAAQSSPLSAAQAEYIKGIEASLAQEPSSYPILDDVVETISNIPESAARYVGGIVEAVTSPVQTADSMMSLGYGALKLMEPERERRGFSTMLRPGMNPAVAARDIPEDPERKKLARMVGQALYDRYGSIESAKKSLINDPVGVMGDLSAVLGLGGVGIAKTAGTVSAAAKTAGEMVRAAGARIEPISAAGSLVSGAGRIPGEAVAGYAGLATGAGTTPIKKAYEAGKAGGAKAEAFRESITKSVQQENVLEQARSALSTMRQQKNAEYQSAMERVGRSQEIISFDSIIKTLSEKRKEVEYKGIITNEKAADKLSDVLDEITAWSKLNPAEYHTAFGMDQLKQKIGSILESIPPNERKAYRVVKAVYDKIKQEIIRQAPVYSHAMKSYSAMSDLISEIERTLNVGNRSSADTAMRKLQSLMRDNVQTNYGQRVRLGKILEEVSGQPIMTSLAGQALQDTMPRGIVRAGVPVFGAASMAGVPAAAAQLAVSSPRLVGEAAYRAGQIMGAPSRAASRLPQGLLDTITDPILRNILSQAYSIQEAQ